MSHTEFLRMEQEAESVLRQQQVRAAAPDLLAACEAARKRCNDDDDMSAILADIDAILTAAISAAKGE